MKSFFKYLAVILLTFVLTLSLSSTASVDSVANEGYSYVNNRLLQRVVNTVREKYIDDISDEALYEKAIEGLLGSLDPHSGFLNEKDYAEMRISTSGEFGGIGVEITMEKGVLKVVSPIDDTPAFKAGLKTNDYITKIDNNPVQGMGLSESVNKIRGKKGTVVKLTVIRAEEAKPLEFFVERDIIKIASVTSEVKVDDIAYFRIKSFSQDTTDNLRKQYKQIHAKQGKPRGIVLDLRNNPGGLLDQAVGVAGLFLSNKEIVSIKGRTDEEKQVMISDVGEVADDLPIIVLINEGSASASEIVAGALQDHKRAIIVGSKSFGKGSVQTIIPLVPNKIAMRLTTSLYYTPSGRSIQAEGIVPDVEIKQEKLSDDNVADRVISEADLPGHLANGNHVKEKQQQDSKQKLEEIYKKDYQLGRAIDLIYIYEIIQGQVKDDNPM